MKRAEVETIVKEFGFEGVEDTYSHKENGMIYTFPRSGGYGSIIIDGVDLFVNDWAYLRIEIDDYSLVARLYHDHAYVGCIVYAWTEIDEFMLKKGF